MTFPVIFYLWWAGLFYAPRPPSKPAAPSIQKDKIDD
jgi:hypothetical protein